MDDQERCKISFALKCLKIDLSRVQRSSVKAKGVNICQTIRIRGQSLRLPLWKNSHTAWAM